MNRFLTSPPAHGEGRGKGETGNSPPGLVLVIFEPIGPVNGSFFSRGPVRVWTRLDGGMKTTRGGPEEKMRLPRSPTAEQQDPGGLRSRNTTMKADPAGYRLSGGAVKSGARME